MLVSRYFSNSEVLVQLHIGEGALECQSLIKFLENKKSEKPTLTCVPLSELC